MMQEVLEEFVEAQQLGGRFVIDSEDRPTGDRLTLAPLWLPKDRDLAQEFLDGDEMKRAEMRKLPVPRGLYIDKPKPTPRRMCSWKYPGFRLLSNDEVIWVRKWVGSGHTSGREAARRLGVSRMTIQRVLKGATYK